MMFILEASWCEPSGLDWRCAPRLADECGGGDGEPDGVVPIESSRRSEEEDVFVPGTERGMTP